MVELGIEKFLGCKDYKYNESYINGLDYYWQGRYLEAEDLLSRSILDGVSEYDLTLMYRLWMQSLYFLDSKSGIIALRQHFNDSDFSESLSLRLISHFLNDEWQAINLHWPGLGVSSWYGLEFKYRVSRRLSPNNYGEFLAAGEGELLQDYLHWDLGAQELLLLGDQGLLKDFLDLSQEVFPNSPLKNEYLFYVSMEHSEYHKALENAKILWSKFPLSFNYRYIYAHVLRKMGNFEEAVQHFSALIVDDENPDVLFELAACHDSLQGDSDKVYSTHWQKSTDYINRATKSAFGMGFYPFEILRFKERFLKDENEDLFAESICYLLFVEEVEYYRLIAIPNNEYEFTIPSHLLINKNDMFFVARRKYWQSDVVRVGAFLDCSVGSVKDKPSKSLSKVSLYCRDRFDAEPLEIDFGEKGFVFYGEETPHRQGYLFKLNQEGLHKVVLSLDIDYPYSYASDKLSALRVLV